MTSLVPETAGWEFVADELPELPLTVTEGLLVQTVTVTPEGVGHDERLFPVPRRELTVEAARVLLLPWPRSVVVHHGVLRTLETRLASAVADRLRGERLRGGVDLATAVSGLPMMAPDGAGLVVRHRIGLRVAAVVDSVTVYELIPAGQTAAWTAYLQRRAPT